MDVLVEDLRKARRSVDAADSLRLGLLEPGSADCFVVFLRFASSTMHEIWSVLQRWHF